jgi:putative DNA primase/helicase
MSKQERNQFPFENIPAELKALPNWVCYRMEHRGGQSKPTKVPYNPVTNDNAKANDPATWLDYETCVTAASSGDYAGIGFEFAPPYVGIDLDRCRDAETGMIEDWAQEIIGHLDSYTEASPSRTGIHIIIKGSLPPGRRRSGPVEMYDAARFFTMSGDHIPGAPETIEERSEAIAELHEALFAANDDAVGVTVAPAVQGAGSVISDKEIIERASMATNGEKFRKLWTGDWNGMYGSQSEADQALCCELAFWTGKDQGRMDSLFRQSGLYRAKWERADYRSDTIANAVRTTNTVYTISKKEHVEKLYAGFAGNRAQLRATKTTVQQTAQEPQQSPIPEEQPTVSSNFEGFRYGHTDLGNSERFILQHGYNVRYCVESATWHLWNGTRWQPDNLKQIHQLAKETVKAMYSELATESDGEKRKELFKFIQKSESERSLNALVNLAKTDPRIAVGAEAFDSQIHLLNCMNGTIDLRTGKLLHHRREDLITKQCPVEFDPNATSETWERFLRDCTRADADLQGFLQRAVGYTLFGDPREQVILMVNGPGGTGKSTFIAAVMMVLGDYAKTADFTTFLKKDRVNGGPSDDVANLAGARLVSSIEVDDGKHLAQALVKQLTGGDVIRARHLYQASFEFSPQFALWLVCNHAPAVAHDDDAMWRRILRLPFENVIPQAKRDNGLKTALTDPESAGRAVLAWAVKGCVEWHTNGLQVPAAVTKATDAYKAKSNPLTDFVTEECELASSGFTTVADLRRAYDSWCSDNGEKNILNRNQFTTAIKDLGCSPSVRSGNRVWVGVALRSSASSIYTTVAKSTSAVAHLPFEAIGSAVLN